MYQITLIPNDSLLITVHPEYGQQLWSTSRMTKLHNRDRCAICGAVVGSQAYRPITNKSNRMERICLRHGHLSP